MEQKNFCKNCADQNQCRQVYHTLGNTKGSCVTAKVLYAFLLPIITFIAALIIFDRSFDKYIISKELQTILGFLTALSTAIFCILTKYFISKKPGKST